MKKMSVIKRILAGALVVATMAMAGKTAGVVTDNQGAVAEAVR